MSFIKQFTSPGGKAPPAQAATTGDEGGAAPPTNTPTAATAKTASASASAPAVSGGGGGDETPTTLGHALGKTLSEVQQGGSVAALNQAQLAAYGQELGAAAAGERARAPHKSVAALGRGAAGEAWDDLRGGPGGGAPTKTGMAMTKAEDALRGDGDGQPPPQQPKDAKAGAGAGAHKPVTRSSAASLGGSDGDHGGSADDAAAAAASFAAAGRRPAGGGSEQ